MKKERQEIIGELITKYFQRKIEKVIFKKTVMSSFN